MDKDERVFGTYGPGAARDVLSQLLDGSGYNVLLIGDRGQGTPRRVVLSGRSGANGQAPPTKAQSAPSDEDSEGDQQADQPAEQPQPEPPPPPLQNGPAPGVPVRTPQQILQEMQQRQQQIQQQQQQNPQH
jgi:hypothetical protein